MKTKSSE